MQPAQVLARQALFTQWATPLYHRSSAVKLAFRRVQNLLIHKKHNISTTFQTQLSEVPKSPLLHDERRATMYELYQKRKDVGSRYPRTRSLSLVRQHFSIFLAKLIEASLNSIAKRIFSCKNRCRYSRKRAKFCQKLATTLRGGQGSPRVRAPARPWSIRHRLDLVWRFFAFWKFEGDCGFRHEGGQ